MAESKIFFRNDVERDGWTCTYREEEIGFYPNQLLAALREPVLPLAVWRGDMIKKAKERHGAR